jgi:hypothetical protein
MMTATHPAAICYDGDGRYLLAIHEAGHAVTHLLLGHHVPDVEIRVTDHGHTENVRGSTTYTGVEISVLAELVGTAAGEAAQLRFLKQQRHPDAEMIARAVAEHDRVRTNALAADMTLPQGIETAMAERLVASRWGAVERVARALRDAPGHRLEAVDVLSAADLGNDEVSWELLGVLADAVMPDHPGVTAYLAGAGQQQEDVRADFLSQMRHYGVLEFPETALRRQVHAEIYRRGVPELLAALATAKERAR